MSKEATFEPAKRKLKYVNSTINVLLLFKNHELLLHGFINVDLGGDLNDKKSIINYVFLFN